MGWIATIVVERNISDDITARLWDLQTDGVAETEDASAANVTLLAGFPTESSALDAVRALADVAVRTSVDPVDPTAWATPTARQIRVAGHSITIDARQSFGHGHHPTTRLCLDLLADRVLTDPVAPDTTVLDVGTGSGVLAIAASILGASDVTAIDVDPAAVATAQRNAESNGVAIACSDVAIADLEGRFDVIVANMLIAEFEPIAAEVRRLAAKTVVVSGCLLDQADRVGLALGVRAEEQHRVESDGWSALVFEVAA